MPRDGIKAENAMRVLLPYQRFPSGRAIANGQRVDIDAAWDPLTECAAPVPIRRTTSINVIPSPLLPSSRTDIFIIVFAFGLWDVNLNHPSERMNS